MKELTDHLLLKTYIQAHKLDLPDDFIEILNQEIHRRQESGSYNTSLYGKEKPSPELTRRS
ncbi:sporulation histidine kinase inhibitor Sda [Halobacillus litoralis]|uniref:sporulation histidine kinase inhibitor Sda n=1 Tax=Halobacillus litoralis TaxID=45668 RepID=UPI001CFCA6EE|nr:sporulation histidine kinase inhibitor Sda [Halobacillus litoralis]